MAWAREGRWDDLIDYCMSDTVLTHRVSSMARVVVPLTGVDHRVVCTLATPPLAEAATATTTELSFERLIAVPPPPQGGR